MAKASTSVVSKEFEKAMAASKTAAKRFHEAKKATPSSGSFFPEEIFGEGNNWSGYIRVTASADKTKEGTPRVRLHNTIVIGEFKGKSWYSDFYLKDENEEREQQNWDRLSKAIQVLCDVDQDDMDGWQIPEMIAKLEEINDAAPCCKVGAQRNLGKTRVDPKTKKPMPQKWFYNTYYNELVDVKDIAAEETTSSNGSVRTRSAREKPDETEQEVEGEDQELSFEEAGALADEGDEDCITSLTEAATEAGLDPDDFPTWTDLATELAGSEGDDSGDDDQEDTGAEEAGEKPQPEKGGYVWYKPPRFRKETECEVISVNKRAETCNLKQYEGTGKWENVPFAECEVVEEEIQE